MQRALLFKLLTIAALSVLLLVPLSMIEGQIAARSQRQHEVIANIAESAAGPQTLVGPVLLLRYRERVERRSKDEASGRESVSHEIVEHSRVLPPQRLDIAGDARVETRSRGLYRARLFHLGLKLAGSFALPARLGVDGDAKIVDARAFLVLGIADPRGVGNDPEVRINGSGRRLATGTLGALAGQGVHVPLGDVDPAQAQAWEFSLPLALTGSQRLAIAPAGEATTVTLKSDWPHPGFQGRFLPVERSVGADGFSARWQVSHLARSFERVLKSGDPAQAGVGGETLAIGFIDPVNVYLKSERAVKYGVLFVVLGFAAFFLHEVLRRRPMHPLQYLLVGLALAIFFLLLIALSEHFEFWIAYAVSAAACVLLIGSYLAGALGGRRRGAAFAAGIAGLYGVLYGVLLSEDNALLMGAVLLFVALGATMLATRRIDWYRLGAGTDGNKAAGEAA